MRLIQKTIVLVIVCSLLGPNSLWAKVQPQLTLPLAEVQEQARQDRSWLQEHQLAILTGWSVLATLGTIKFAIDKTQQRQRIKLLSKEIANAQQEVAQAKQLKAQLEVLENNYKAQTARLQKLTATNHNLEEQLKNIKEAYLLKLRSTEKDFSSFYKYIDNLQTPLSATTEKMLESYVPLLDASLPEKQYRQLRLRFSREPLMQGLSKEERRTFFRMLDDLIVYQRAAAGKLSIKLSKDECLIYSSQIVRNYLLSHPETNQKFVLRFLRKAMDKNYLLSLLGVVSMLSVPALNAQAQAKSPLAQRIENNFDLFLNASPEELAELEQDPQAYKACVTGTDTYHQITLLSEQEQAALRQSLPVLSVVFSPKRKHTLAY